MELLYQRIGTFNKVFDTCYQHTFLNSWGPEAPTSSMRQYQQRGLLHPSVLHSELCIQGQLMNGLLGSWGHVHLPSNFPWNDFFFFLVVAQSPCGQNPYLSESRPCSGQSQIFGLLRWGSPGGCSSVSLSWRKAPLHMNQRDPFPSSLHKIFYSDFAYLQHSLKEPWRFLMNPGVSLSPLGKG